MNRRLTATALIASLAVTATAIPAQVANAQTVTRPAQDIVLSIGRGELVTVPGTMADVFVANDAVADVQVKSQRQLYIFGKAGGETTVYASNARGDIVWSANIRVGSNISSVDQMLALAMPEAKISVATMGANTVLLTGTVAAPEDAAEAERLVVAFLGDDANVISRLRMATPLAGQPAGPLRRSQPLPGPRHRCEPADGGRDRRVPVRCIHRPCGGSAVPAGRPARHRRDRGRRRHAGRDQPGHRRDICGLRQSAWPRYRRGPRPGRTRRSGDHAVAAQPDRAVG